MREMRLIDANVLIRKADHDIALLRRDAEFAAYPATIDFLEGLKGVVSAEPTVDIGTGAGILEETVTQQMTRRELMIYYANRIKGLMQVKGLSQRELAERAGLEEATISRYINAQRLPNLYSLHKIMRVLIGEEGEE